MEERATSPSRGAVPPLGQPLPSPTAAGAAVTRPTLTATPSSSSVSSDDGEDEAAGREGGFPGAHFSPQHRNAPQQRTATLEHNESIYSFMLLYPELHRVKLRSYWNAKSCLAFVLFGINLLMQITLTQVTGIAILSDNLSFRDSLVNHYIWSVEDVLGKDASNAIMGLRTKVTSWVYGQEESLKKCCWGPDCAQDYPCCVPERNGSSSSGKGHFVQNETLGFEVTREPRPRARFLQGRQRRAAILATDALSDGHGKPSGSSAGGSGKKGKKESDGGTESGRTTTCFDDGKTLDCSQPTFRFAQQWEDLDFDGDGLWTAEEAENDPANLQCRLADSGLTSEAVFKAACEGILHFREEEAWDKYLLVSSSGEGANRDTKEGQKELLAAKVPKSIQERKAIPRDWFHFWKGMVSLCSAIDLNRCGELVSSGFFDGALAIPGNRSGLAGLDTALDLCQHILRRNGWCDQSLPVTFVMYRAQTLDKCGDPSFLPGGEYVNPFQPTDTMATVSVTYSTLGTYEMAGTMRFRVFLLLILVIWFVNLLGEISMIINLIDFALNFPVSDDDPFNTKKMLHSISDHKTWAIRRASQQLKRMVNKEEEEVQASASQPSPGRPSPFWRNQLTARATPRDDGGGILISSVSRPHKITTWIMIVIRLLLVVYMAGVGSIFILTTYSYPDLLMNAVALAFVFELPAFLYNLIVEKHDKDVLASISPLEYPSSLPNRSKTLRLFTSSYFLGLVVFPLICIFLVDWDRRWNIEPSHEALECLCLQRGSRCVATPVYDKAWWDAHWSRMTWLFEPSR